MILVDESPDARHRFLSEHAPIPGTVIQPDDAGKETILARLISPLVVPSFVLTDPEGRVVTTSAETRLSEVAASR